MLDCHVFADALRSSRYVRGVSNWNFDIEDLKVCVPTALSDTMQHMLQLV